VNDLEDVPVAQLVEQFVDVAVQQYKVARAFDTRTYRRLYRRMEEICDELKRRPGDQRAVLISLFGHPNAQVRLMAAHAMLAIAPVEARAQIEAIHDSKIPIQSLSAGMTLVNLDNGFYKPT